MSLPGLYGFSGIAGRPSVQTRPFAVLTRGPARDQRNGLVGEREARSFGGELVFAVASNQDDLRNGPGTIEGTEGVAEERKAGDTDVDLVAIAAHAASRPGRSAAARA